MTTDTLKYYVREVCNSSTTCSAFPVEKEVTEEEYGKLRKDPGVLYRIFSKGVKILVFNKPCTCMT